MEKHLQLIHLRGGGECVGAMGEYTSAEWTEAEKEIESPPRLGLGTVNITSFVE